VNVKEPLHMFRSRVVDERSMKRPRTVFRTR